MFEEETNNLAEEAENVEETTEETEEGIEFTDTADAEEVETEPVEETEEVTEPVKDEPEKIYTEDEFNEKFDAKFKRREAKLRREYEKKYSKLENILNAGLGTSSVEEATSRLNDYYKEQGIDIPDVDPRYSDDDIRILADKDADEIISLGEREIKEEGDRLANLGKDMTQREKLTLERLTSKMKEIEEMKELSSIGVSKEEVFTDEFKEYEKKLNPNLSLKEKWEMYLSTKPKKEIKEIGSMKNDTKAKKDFYTMEEISRLTEEDLDDPEVYEIARKSMLKNAPKNYY